MNHIFKILISTALLISVQASYAGTYGSGNGKISTMAAGAIGTGHVPKDMIYFHVDNQTFGDCTQGNATPYFVIDTKASGGSAMAAMLLAAKMADKEIWIAGKGTCETFDKQEDVSYMYFK